MNRSSRAEQDTDLMTMYPTRWDVLLFRAHRILARYRDRVVSFLGGILMGRLINELSSPDLKTLLKNMFWLKDRPLNWFTWLILAAIFFLFGLSSVVRRERKKRSYEALLLSITQRLKDPSLVKYNAIAVEHALTLQKCPELDRGWLLSDADVMHSTLRFQLPDSLKTTFEEYSKEKRFRDDNISIMITENPSAFIDSPRLQLRTCESHYNHAQFYRERIAWDSSQREDLIATLLEGKVVFPHNLCMHLLVVTQDEKVLITKRSSKVDYYPNYWSCSIEEQFSRVDVEGGRRASAVQHWVVRALEEELGLTTMKYSLENVRILSVFLESNILNIGICAIVRLDIDHCELSQIIQALPRKDYEFTEWDYLDYDEMAVELVHPRRRYHPTSRYRMLLGLIHRYGEADFGRRFLTALTERQRV